MKIRRLEIVAFGKWRNKTVNFSPDMMVVYGDNEAGKSTLYHFIRTMLFGFSARDKKSQLYKPKDTEQFGGRLWLTIPGYGDVKIERFESVRKGKATVYFEEGIEGDEQVLKELLSPLTMSLFDEIYSLDPDQLFDYKGLSEDALQRSLLSLGATGSHRLMQLTDEYNRERQKLYKVKGRVPELNQLLEKYRELNRRITEKEANEKNYQTLCAKEEQLIKVLNDNRKTVAELQSRKQVVEDQIKSYSLYVEMQELLEHRDSNNLFSDISQKEDYQELLVKYDYIKEEKESYHAKQLAILNESTASPAVKHYLAHQEELEKASLGFSEMEQTLLKESWLSDTVTELMSEVDSIDKKLEYSNVFEKNSVSKRELMEVSHEEIENLARQENEVNMTMSELNNKVEEEKSREAYYMSHLEREQGQLIKWGLVPLIALLIGLVMIVSSQATFGLVLVVLGGILMGTVGYRLFTTKQLLRLSKERQSNETTSQHLVTELNQVSHEQSRILLEKQRLAQELGFNSNQLVEKWLGYLPLLNQKKRLLQKIETQQFELERLNNQFKAYQDNLYCMDEWLPPLTLSKKKWLSELQRFYTEVGAKARQQLKVGDEPERIGTLAELTRREEEISQKLLVLSNGQLETIEDVKAWLVTATQKEQEDARLNQLQHQLSGVFSEHLIYSEQDLREEEEKLTHQLHELQDNQPVLADQLQAYRFDIKQHELDGSLAVLYQEQSELECELTRLSEKWSTYKLGETVVTKLLERLTSERLSHLLLFTSEILAELTENNYVECRLLEGRLVICNHEGVCYHLDELSTGTRDQLILSVRLAFILSYQQEIKAPLIIDDAWLHYDQQRKIQLFNVLQKMSQDNQVICLSSDQELMTYAEVNELKMDYL